MIKNTTGIIPGLHFDKIYENAIKPLTLAGSVECSRSEKTMTISVWVEDTLFIKRVIEITDLDYGNNFGVCFTETAVECDFITRTERFEIKATKEETDEHHDQPTDMSYLYRRIRNFLQETFVEGRVPPKELIAHRDYINTQWLQSDNVKVVLYLESNRLGDWRFLILDDETLIVAYLDPAITGHTCRMLVSAARDAFKRGVLEGRVQVAEETAVKAFTAALAGSASYYAEQYTPEIQAIVKSGLVRKNKQII